MGIRLKILLTFILCFGLMSAVGLRVLEDRMSESYDAFERQYVVTSMERVEQSFEAAATSLSRQINDWAVWTELYNYVRKPDIRWANENIGQDALKPAELSLALVITQDGRVLHLSAHDDLARTMPEARPGSLAPQTDDYLRALRMGDRKTRCGLMKTKVGIMMVCRAGVVRSDGSGKVAGTLVMGRLLDVAGVQKLHAQTQLPFDMHQTTQMPPDLTLWPGVIAAGSVGHSDFWTSLDPAAIHVYYPLHDILGRDIALITLDLPRSMHEEGQRVYRELRVQFIVTLLVVTGLLALALHFLVIRRLHHLAAQLDGLAQHSKWETDIEIDGRDELSRVASNVNRLLAVIRSQIEGLNELSLKDGLTGLSNRRAFDDRLSSESLNARRTGEPLTLLLGDVDYFKRYNDHYGHQAGDEALKAVAASLDAAIRRPRDIAARIGGEEFAVLLPGTDIAGAVSIAEQIRRGLAQHAIAHADSPAGEQLTISLGIARFADEPPTRLMQRADHALYTAKAAGRNRIVCDDPTTAEALPADTDETDPPAG